MNNLTLAQNMLLTGEFAFLFKATPETIKQLNTKTFKKLSCVGNLEFYGYKTIDRLLTIESTSKKILSLKNFQTAFIFKDNSTIKIETTKDKELIQLANGNNKAALNQKQTLLYITN